MLKQKNILLFNLNNSKVFLNKKTILLNSLSDNNSLLNSTFNNSLLNNEITLNKDIKLIKAIHHLHSTTIHAWLHSFNSGHIVALLDLSKYVFNGDVRLDLINRALVYENSWRAQGTQSTKSLGQVRGSGKKAFPQKGRGKARVHSLRAPHFRGGFNCHGPRPHLRVRGIQRKVFLQNQNQ